jgi:hypothetical protein
MSFFSDRSFKFILGVLVFLFVLITVQNAYAWPPTPPSPAYTDSAHGNYTPSPGYGVNRSSLSSFGYSIGNCAHCHEQHASIGGSEPAPPGYSGDPTIDLKYMLFYNNYVSQTDGVCFECHDNTTTISATAIDNYSYSYRAGGWTSDTLDNILEAFTNPPSISSHDLGDIRTFITGKSWSYTSNSNPCAACHNPHRAQGDPADSSLPKNSTATRGWPVSLPSQHNTDNNEWGLWGDNISDDSPYGPSTERMSDYTTSYQAPCRYSSLNCGTVSGSYEPDGSTTKNGSNLTNFVTFCQDCHSSDMTSTPYSLPNTPIDWTTLGGETGGDKHGKNVATDTTAARINLREPYLTAWTSSGLVLACTDCHEPHGAPNMMLIRNEINGTTLEYNYDTPSSQDLKYVCNRCHTAGTSNQLEDIHHGDTGAPYYSAGGCMKGGGCHGGTKGSPINCDHCHFHGGDDDWILSTTQSSDHTDRRTF